MSAPRPPAPSPPPTGMIGGPEKRAIRIVDYDPSWPAKFEEHAARVRGALGERALRVEHIGSTSVPDLPAKPIVDMLVVVADAADEDGYLPRMEAAGYVLRVREPHFHEHRMFRTPAIDVHIHFVSAGSVEVDRWLTFRDRLRRNAGERELYARTKRELAQRDWSDMNAYADAKSEVVEGVIAAARADDQGIPLPRPRPVARVVLLSPDDRVLLFDTDLAYTRVWMTPGGGLKPGESFEDGALRELWEETGLRGVALGPCVWAVRFRFRIGDVTYDQNERYFVARAPALDVQATHREKGEIDEIKQHRWWSADEIAASPDCFRPRALAALLPPILAGTHPDTPVAADVERCARTF